MIKLALIDMPFSLIECAAFGLSQIKTDLDKTRTNKVKTNIHYINHDFLSFFGENLYRQINNDFYDFYKFETNKHLWVDKLKKSGLEVEYFGGMFGDWIFRQEAFPEASDNTDLYFERYFPNNSNLKNYIIEKRKKISDFLYVMVNKYNLLDYDVIGFTSRFQQQMAALALARILKKLKPEIYIVMGGANCEPPAGAAIAKYLENVDYVFSGRRFLIGFREFIDCLYSNQTNEIEKIHGVFSKKKHIDMDGIDPYEMSIEDNIDDLVDLDYNDFFESIEQHFPNRKIEPILFYETSRGCSWGEKSRCTFCAIDGYNPAHRKMSSAKAIEYLNNIFNQYGKVCKYFVFVDSTLPKEYLYEVFPYVNIPEEALLLYEARADFNEYEISLLAKYHIRLMIVGIESFSTPALNLLNKGTTAFDNIKFLKNCRKYDIAVNWNILVGIPGETDDMLIFNKEVVQKLEHLFPPTGIWMVSFQGNCFYNEYTENFGIELKPDIEGLQYAYPFDDETLQKITYFNNIAYNMSKSKAVLIQKLSKSTQKWKNKWYDASSNKIPNLVLIGKTIYDSRLGDKTIIHISSLDEQIITFLQNEYNISDIVKNLKVSESIINERLAFLLKHNLLFKEDDIYISLVIN